MSQIDEFITDALIQDFINELVAEAVLILEPLKPFEGAEAHTEWLKLCSDSIKNGLQFGDSVLKRTGKSPEQREKHLIIKQKDTLVGMVAPYDRSLANQISEEIIQTVIPHRK